MRRHLTRPASSSFTIVADWLTKMQDCTLSNRFAGFDILAIAAIPVILVKISLTISVSQTHNCDVCNTLQLIPSFALTITPVMTVLQTSVESLLDSLLEVCPSLRCLSMSYVSHWLITLAASGGKHNVTV